MYMHKVNCFPGIVITAVLLILIMVKNFHNDPHATNVVHIKEDVLDLLLGVPSSSRSSSSATTAAPRRFPGWDWPVLARL